MRKARSRPVAERTFLGYSWYNTVITIAKTSVKRFKNKVRAITKRNRGRSIELIIKELNPLIRGWIHYFKLAPPRWQIGRIDAWIRRKLRCYRIKQCKRVYTLVKFLMSRDLSKLQAWKVALSGKGWWRKSHTQQVEQAMGVAWFEQQGLLSLQKIRMSL